MELSETTVLTKLTKYNRPVKTKHLAKRLQVDSSVLMGVINKLKKKNKVSFEPQTDSFSDDAFGWGWVKLDICTCEKCNCKNKTSFSSVCESCKKDHK